MRKKGFTLIELLAVIIILAIIALIAVPIVINLIEKSRRSAFEDSVYGVVKAGELYYAESVMDDEGFNGETFDFETSSGVAKLNLKGTAPTKGWMTIDGNGNISLSVTNGKYTADKNTNQSKLTITDGDNVKANTGGPKKLGDISVSQLGVTRPSCSDSGTCSVGTAFALEVAPSVYKKFYVMADDGSKVTLIMNENLGGTLAWLDYDKYNDYGLSRGPVTLLEALDERTSTWSNIPEFTYTLVDEKPDGSQFDGSEELPKYDPFEVTAKARLMTRNEAVSFNCVYDGSCPSWLVENLDSDENPAYGYWLSTAAARGMDRVWKLVADGHIEYDTCMSTSYGIRPVIEISR